MKMKKLLSLVLAIVFICGIFASVPFVNAAAPFRLRRFLHRCAKNLVVPS